jgi:hypothetical protein
MLVFLVLSFIRWDGQGFIFHTIVGTVCAALFLVHVTIHWKWLKSVTKKFFARRIGKALRGKFLIDVLLILIWSIAIVSGVLAIGYFSFGVYEMAAFSRIHAISSRLGLLFIAIHIAQHRTQIKSYLGIKNKPKNNST